MYVMSLWMAYNLHNGLHFFDCGTFFTPPHNLSRDQCSWRICPGWHWLTEKSSSSDPWLKGHLHLVTACLQPVLTIFCPFSASLPSPSPQIPAYALHTAASAWSFTHSSALAFLLGRLLLQASAASVNVPWIPGHIQTCFLWVSYVDLFTALFRGYSEGTFIYGESVHWHLQHLQLKCCLMIGIGNPFH